MPQDETKERPVEWDVSDLRHVRGGRPAFVSDPAVDRLIPMIMALVGEVSVLRDRLDSHERLLERHGIFGPKEVDAYVPDDHAEGERDDQRNRLIAKVLRLLEAELSALDSKGDAPYEKVLKQVDRAEM